MSSRMKPIRRAVRTLLRRVQSAPTSHEMAVLSAQEGYNLWAPSYGQPQTPLQVIESETLEPLLPDLRQRSLLDIGCGRGRIAHLALQRGASRAIGLDLSLAMLEQARRQPKSSLNGSAQLLAGNVLHLPFKAQFFDVVVAALVLGHVRELGQALQQIAGVTGRGGYVLISDFHPLGTLRGWQRTFVDKKTGRVYAVEQHLHLLEEYLSLFQKLSIHVEELREPLYQGFPVVFVLRGRRN